MDTYSWWNIFPNYSVFFVFCFCFLLLLLLFLKSWSKEGNIKNCTGKPVPNWNLSSILHMKKLYEIQLIAFFVSYDKTTQML